MNGDGNYCQLVSPVMQFQQFYFNYQRGSITSCTSAGIARAKMSVHLFVCLVCLSHSGIVSKRTKPPHDFFTYRESKDPSFCRYHVHPEIRKGSPWVSALNETGVGIGLVIFDIYTIISPKWCKIGPRLLLITNRKSHMCFHMVSKSTTLFDCELTLNGYYALCYITHVFRSPPIKL